MSATARRQEHERRHEHRIFAGYRGGAEMPLGAFAALMAAYGATSAGLIGAATVARGRLPERIGLRDIALLGVATHKVSRLITRDWVTAPLRAAFTEYKGSTGAGEVEETPRGEGLRLALGELFT